VHERAQKTEKFFKKCFSIIATINGLGQPLVVKMLYPIGYRLQKFKFEGEKLVFVQQI
jgi:hypothetical protein